MFLRGKEVDFITLETTGYSFLGWGKRDLDPNLSDFLHDLQ